MKRRWMALLVLMLALLALLAIGFYRSVTGQDTHPRDSGGSAAAADARNRPGSTHGAGHAAPGRVSTRRMTAMERSSVPAVSSVATVGVAARSCAAKHDSGTASVA